MDKYESLKLENQLCFPLYACGKEISRAYKPFLDRIDLTYTQYLVMMLLWEHECMSVNCVGKKLYLDSGTLSPLLKKLEEKGFVERCRCDEDEREVHVYVTDKGEALKDEALRIRKEIGECVDLNAEESAELYRLCYKVLGNITK